jgi:hypothetical protein
MKFKKDERTNLILLDSSALLIQRFGDVSTINRIIVVNGNSNSNDSTAADSYLCFFRPKFVVVNGIHTNQWRMENRKNLTHD